jgi:hypothetical protein
MACTQNANADSKSALNQIGELENRANAGSVSCGSVANV